jgi:hypothetical protein
MQVYNATVKLVLYMPHATFRFLEVFTNLILIQFVIMPDNRGVSALSMLIVGDPVSAYCTRSVIRFVGETDWTRVPSTDLQNFGPTAL